MRFDSADLGANARASVMISMIELLSSPEFDLSVVMIQYQISMNI